MRRGNLNKTSYIIIVVSAIFTVISYVSDQLVIKYENNLRLNKFNFQSLDTEIKSLDATSRSLENLKIESDVLVSKELKNRNFMIKHLILIEADKEELINHKENLDIFIEEDFPIHNIKAKARIATRNLVDNIVEIKNSYENIFKENFFEGLDFYSSKEFIKNLSGVGLFRDNSDKFYEIRDWATFRKDLNVTKIDDLTLRHWFDIRNFRLLISEILFNETKKLDEVIKYIDKIIEDKEHDLNILFFETKKLDLS